MRTMRIGSVLFVCAAASICAQSPEFETASIRLNTSWPVMGIGPGIKGGLFTGQAIVLRSLIANAWGLAADRVVGPGWLDKDRYDIAARSPQGVPDSELKPMLQALLRDRFKISVHTEPRPMSFYELVVAEGGVKMTHNVAEQPHPKYKHATGITVIAQRMTMLRLAEMLSNVAGKPIVDRTDLAGTFAIALQTGSAIPSEAGAADPGDEAPDVFRAVQEQLGLKLRPAKGALDVLVIDTIERTPTEN